MVLWYSAGRDPLDIADLHSVKTDDVTSSVWDIVDAIHASPELDIKFPDAHTEQMHIMEGFKQNLVLVLIVVLGPLMVF